MESRRSFLKKASLLAGVAASTHVLPSAIQRALAINAPAGSTYLDAEHIVFLMQENRSFDHCYGALRGVRGFNDPRAIKLPNGLPVWVQQNAKGEYYSPFRLDIANTKATWMGSLPHGWGDMVYARNSGKMDTWLEAKKAGNPDYQHIPLTMGYYDREDIPFYYAFADAFTICDQHFCSSLTGTSANRSYFWSGTVREEPRNPDSVAHVVNGQINYQDVGWKTYPERLQEAGISWKVYQNELCVPVGFEGEQEDWLANFTNNNLEFHRQYHVRFHPAHRAFMEKRVEELTAAVAALPATDGEELAKHTEELVKLKSSLAEYTAAGFEKLPPIEQEMHKRAFVTNIGDPHYHELETIQYTDESGEHSVQVPKGDIFYQFRKDVDEGKLPTVSWLNAPCNYSDHPGAPWFGAWYVSETLDILTRNPEVWKKTIFILTYDENDGYFDHVPPFVPPLSGRPEAGAVARGIDTADEYVTAAQEKVRTGNPDATLDSPIGLGFRVPMVVASPWTKGGWVNSEVCDLTSCLQFLEHFIEKKTGKLVKETNISAWRRLVCGDLTSVFRPATSAVAPSLDPLGRDAYVARIYKAREKGLPGNFERIDPNNPTWPEQEPGTKPACAIPYNLDANAVIAGGILTITLSAMGYSPTTAKSKETLGAPFQVRALLPYDNEIKPGRTWDFAVRHAEPLNYSWPLQNFAEGKYSLQVCGANGFFREFEGDLDDPEIRITATADADGNALQLTFLAERKMQITIKDRSYGGAEIKHMAGTTVDKPLAVNLAASQGWYDLEITVIGYSRFRQRFAGHVETGNPSITDPFMGGQR